MSVVVNYWAVLVAAVASFVIGGAWYSSKMFSKRWQKAVELKPLPDKGMAKPMGGMFISLLVMAYVLAHFVVYVGATTVTDGFKLGFWIWLGFIGMFTITTVVFERRSWTWYWITNGYQLLSIVVMSIILAVWK